MTPEDKPLTVGQRAEKIVDYVESNITHDALVTSEWVAAEIRAAVEEALEESHFYCTPGDAWKMAKAEAYEDAAKIVERGPEHYGYAIAIEIRARAKELK